MHTCFRVDEIIRLVARELVASGGGGSAAALARCCRDFENPVLDTLWETQYQLSPLLNSFLESIWEEAGNLTPRRIPTQAEWIRFQRYARRIRTLGVDPTLTPLSSDFLLMLQHLTLNTPLLPNLKGFTCYETTAAFIPFISLFLSRTTMAIKIKFARTLPAPSPLMIASTIGTLPKMCPNLQQITLSDLPSDPIIIAIVSEIPLILGDSLQKFDVGSPLTPAARDVLYTLPHLFDLGSGFEVQTQLPQVTLPALVKLKIKYSSGYEWLRAFSGAALTKLKIVSFCGSSLPSGNFLGAFKNVALTTTLPRTLSTFIYHFLHPWIPDYPSLFVFKQLKIVTVGNPCRNLCSSMVNDVVVTDLARALPKLQVLKLGSNPCGATLPTGVTTKGLVELACHCVDLATLRVHIRVNSLVQAAVDETGTPPAENAAAARQECSLTALEVGRMLVPDGAASTVALALFHIFPRIQDIRYINPQWASVEDTIRISRRLSNRIGVLAHSSRDIPSAG